MPRDYQPKKSGYALPQIVFMRVKYAIKDYERMRAERERILHGGFGAAYHQIPADLSAGDPTGNKAARLAALTGEVEAIERALHDVGAVFSNSVRREDIDCFDALGAYADYGLFCYMLYDPNSGRQPCRQTWQNFKSMLAHHVARNMGYI